jgi:cell division septum initiation protein DivIVA
MALTGALQADFDPFVKEAQKASAALAVMEGEAKKTGDTLAKTGATMDGFGSTAGKSGTSLSQVTTGLRSVDGSLNALGMSIAKPIAMIEELGVVSKASFASLGLLGTAGAVLATGLAAFEAGKWVAQWSGLNDMIDITVKWLDLTGEAAEKAAYKQEILAKANLTSDHVITDLTEAMDHNYNQVKKHTAEVQTAIHRQAEWEREIRKHRAELPAMLAALENHTATIEQLHKQYGIGTEALTFYVAKTKDQTAAHDEAAKKAEAAAAAQQKLKDSLFGGDSITKANEMIAALGGVGNLSRMTTEEQTKLNAAVGEAVETYKRWGQTAPTTLNEIYAATVRLPPVVDGLGAEWANVGTKFTISAEPILAGIAKMKAETEAYEAETQSMAQAWQQVPPPVKESTASVERLSVAMSSAVHQTDSLFEKLQAGKALFESYQAAGVATGSQIGLDPYNFRNQQKTLLPTMSSTGNTLNVNVNSTEAGDIAGKLVDEMRRNGVRF